MAGNSFISTNNRKKGVPFPPAATGGGTGRAEEVRGAVKPCGFTCIGVGVLLVHAERERHKRAYDACERRRGLCNLPADAGTNATRSLRVRRGAPASPSLTRRRRAPSLFRIAQPAACSSEHIPSVLRVIPFMATPSSVATTPSPQLAYAQPQTPVTDPPVTPNDSPATDEEERHRAVQKFLARAEIGKLTRGLRARLGYATFKAVHNLSQNTLQDLENDPQTPTRVNRSGNYYNNPATQGNSAMTPGGSGRTNTRKGAMAPPPPVTASAGQSLFSSILAPPPAKRARTIHNPQDPPQPAPTKPRPATPPRKGGKTTSRAPEASQSKSKSRKRDKERSNGKEKRQLPGKSEDSAADVNIDIQAATTLTNFLLSTRQSISVGTSSPRSSLSAGSDSGSTNSFRHYAQSSTRTVTAATSTLSESSLPAAHSSTPPLASPSGSDLHHAFPQSSSIRSEGRSTPRTRKRAMYPDSNTPHIPSDTEAADSLLFLATSPSPARPSHVKDRDRDESGSFRVLGGGSGLKGRVLFPTHGGNDETSSTSSRVLRREGSGSFASTLSAASSSEFNPGGSFPRIYAKQVINNRTHNTSPHISPPPDRPGGGLLVIPLEPTITPPTPTEPASSQLLPAAPSPMRPERSHSVPRSRARSPLANPVSMLNAPPSEGKRLVDGPPTPGNASFNLSDFIHVSPSPAGGAGSLSRLGVMDVDIGRRLFEEHHGPNGAAGPAGNSMNTNGSLGAGIDLARS
ncbi:uncharacterized protein FIBRA_03980 [Fibroporia radiculosa]|uniref:Uncharacterized protein n=1 Tax=Fibroporia radiculosa TaxID=599839 RepID=J4H2Q0_9APHY|nr:uncharacterized protein FIBRA_03980 [Fibroporia radiculosa]CCM01909.1 predicted protein [Fibroporia radiculosa]